MSARAVAAEPMRRALELALRGWGHVHPNPLVGAVVVATDGRVVGEGWHAAFGGPHAEIAALRAAGAQAAGASLYVTLEPCSHHGKTPPCTTAILAAGVRRVVYAAADPHPAAAGGAAVLQAAGIEVVGGIEAVSARAQNRIYFHVHERRRCYVALKLAVTLDAQLGMRGRRSSLTGEEAHAATQRLRAGFDAILVGGVTARTDDPLLTVRGVPVRRPPRRVVITEAAELPHDSQLVRTAAEVPTTVVCAEDAPSDAVARLETAGVRVIRARPGTGGLAIDDVLGSLWRDGVQSVLCEGGGRLAASLLHACRVDRLHLYIAPRLLGPAGVPAFPLAERLPVSSWQLEHVARLGADVALEYAPPIGQSD